MPKFEVQWDYRSNYAAFTKGSEVEVEEDLAALINRDSPDVLKPVKKSKKSKKADSTAEDAEAGFDPGAHNVDPVLEYARNHPDELEKIIEAELAGKNRPTLTAALSDLVVERDEED